METEHAWTCRKADAERPRNVTRPRKAGRLRDARVACLDQAGEAACATLAIAAVLGLTNRSRQALA